MADSLTRAELEAVRDAWSEFATHLDTFKVEWPDEDYEVGADGASDAYNASVTALGLLGELTEVRGLIARVMDRETAFWIDDGSERVGAVGLYTDRDYYFTRDDRRIVRAVLTSPETPSP